MWSATRNENATTDNVEKRSNMDRSQFDSEMDIINYSTNTSEGVNAQCHQLHPKLHSYSHPDFTPPNFTDITNLVN